MDQPEPLWEAYIDHFWELNDKAQIKANSIYYDKIYNTLLPPDKSVKILDIGRGGGHFLYYLFRKGYTNIHGVDISPRLTDFVKKEICPNVVNSDALDYLTL